MTTARVISEELKRKIKILVVEDNLLNQKLLVFMLKNWGFNCDISLDGKSAIEKVENNHFDLILMDIELPELNGYEATTYIRDRLKLKVPIIASTAHATDAEKERCMNSGMTGYISKPIRGEELYTIIINTLFPEPANN